MISYHIILANYNGRYLHQFEGIYKHNIRITIIYKLVRSTYQTKLQSNKSIDNNTRNDYF